MSRCEVKLSSGSFGDNLLFVYVKVKSGRGYAVRASLFLSLDVCSVVARRVSLSSRSNSIEPER